MAPDSAASPIAVCVYAGSRLGHDPAHRRAAEELGRGLAERGMALVYGGGRVGMMGALADAALTAGGRVIGVIPRFLERREVGRDDLAALHVVESMHERKARMAELSDAFVVLPGGLGTIDEAIEIITWRQLGLHDRPVLLADPRGYWDALFRQIAAAVAEGFVYAEEAALFERFDGVGAVLARLETIEPKQRPEELRRA